MQALLQSDGDGKRIQSFPELPEIRRHRQTPEYNYSRMLREEEENKMKKVVNIIASVLLLLLMGVNSEAEKNGIVKR